MFPARVNKTSFISVGCDATIIESGSFLVPSSSFLTSARFGVTVNVSNSKAKLVDVSPDNPFSASECSSRRRFLFGDWVADDFSISLDVIIMVCVINTT